MILKINLTPSHSGKSERRGFTVLELAIAISVIAILAAILIPALSGIPESTARETSLIEAKDQYALYLRHHVCDDSFRVPAYVKLGDSYFTVRDGEVTRADGANLSAFSAADCALHETCQSILFDTETAARISAERKKDAAVLLYSQFRDAHPKFFLPASVFILIGDWYYEFDAEGAYIGLLTAAEGQALFLTHKADCTDSAHAACAFVYLEGAHENPYD